MSQANTTKGKPDRLSDIEAVKAFAIAICVIKPLHEKYHSANYTLEYKEHIRWLNKDKSRDYNPGDVGYDTGVVKTLKVYRYKALMGTIEVVGENVSGSPDSYTYTISVEPDVQYGYLKSAMRRLLDGVILYDFSKQLLN